MNNDNMKSNIRHMRILHQISKRLHLGKNKVILKSRYLSEVGVLKGISGD